MCLSLDTFRRNHDQYPVASYCSVSRRSQEYSNGSDKERVGRLTPKNSQMCPLSVLKCLFILSSFSLSSGKYSSCWSLEIAVKSYKKGCFFFLFFFWRNKAVAYFVKWQLVVSQSLTINGCFCRSRVYVTGALKYSLYQGRDGNTLRGSNIIAGRLVRINRIGDKLFTRWNLT